MAAPPEKEAVFLFRGVQVGIAVGHQLGARETLVTKCQLAIVTRVKEVTWCDEGGMDDGCRICISCEKCESNIHTYIVEARKLQPILKINVLRGSWSMYV